MNIGAAFPSTYLKASDIPEGTGVIVKIEDVKVEEVGQGRQKEQKPVLYFVGKEKGMVLNKTNANTVAKAYGDETETWRGKAVQIISTETEFQGEMVACLRLRIPNAARTAAAHNGGGQAAPLRQRGEEIRGRAPVESPVSEEEQFAADDIPF